LPITDFEVSILLAENFQFSALLKAHDTNMQMS